MSAALCLQSSVHADSGTVLPLIFRPPGTVEFKTILICAGLSMMM